MSLAAVASLEHFTPAEPQWSLIITQGSEVLGFIHALAREGKMNDAICRIGGLMNLVVVPQCRNQGLGKQLFLEGLRFLLRDQGVDLCIGFPAEDKLFCLLQKTGLLR